MQSDGRAERERDGETNCAFFLSFFRYECVRNGENVITKLCSLHISC